MLDDLDDEEEEDEEDEDEGEGIEDEGEDEDSSEDEDEDDIAFDNEEFGIGPKVVEDLEEEEMYPGLMNAMNAMNGFLKSLYIARPSRRCRESPTSNTRKDSDRLKYCPDLAAYPRSTGGRCESADSKGLTDMETIQLLFIIKHANHRAGFQDGGKHTTVLADNSASTEVCAQLKSTMTEILNSQFRTSLFTILIHDPYTYLIRGDRTGLILSKAINIRVDPRTFFHFLAAFEGASNVERGVDPTVHFASAAEAKLAQEMLAAWKPARECSAFAVDVPAKEEGEESRRVLVWGAFLKAGSLTWRGSRLYRAWDVKDAKVRVLKEYWRLDADDLEKESRVLEELKREGVPRIPTVVAGNDVLGNETRTQEYVGCSWVRGRPGNACSKGLLSAFGGLGP